MAVDAGDSSRLLKHKVGWLVNHLQNIGLSHWATISDLLYCRWSRGMVIGHSGECG